MTATGGFESHYFQSKLQQFTILHIVSPRFVADAGAATKSDEHTMFFILRGSVTIRRTDDDGTVTETQYLPSQAVLFRHTGESSARSEEGLEMIMLTLPGDLLAKRGLNLDDLRLTPGPAVDLIVDVLKKFVLIGPPANNLAEIAFARALEEALFALLVSQPQDPVPSKAPFDQMRYDRTIQVIQQRSDDPQLTPQRLADEVGTPLRSLQRLFAAAGTTVADQIQLARVRNAEAILTSANGRGLRVGEVAAKAGFSSEARLRTAMSDVSGIGPRAFRTGRHG